MIDFTLYEGVSAVAIIVALVQIIKSFGLEQKYSPIVAIIIGVGLSVAYSYYGTEKLFESIVLGIVAGLSAVGIYSSAKNIKEGINK